MNPQPSTLNSQPSRSQIYCEQGCGYEIKGSNLAQMGCDVLRHFSEKHQDKVMPMFVEACEYIEKKLQAEIRDAAQREPKGKARRMRDEG